MAILPLFFILATTMAQPAIGGRQATLNKESQNEWQRVTPKGEEFSILTPRPLAFIDQTMSGTLDKNDEKVLEQHSYSVYDDGVILVIESLKAERPQRLLENLSSGQDQRIVFDREITISGFSGKQYRFNTPNFYGGLLSFVTKKHVYLITIATRENNNASVANITKFLSSLILGDKISEPATGYAFDMKESDLYKSALSSEGETVQSQDQAFSVKDVTRKAYIVWRPEPRYTENARNKNVNGTVVLKAVFDADGQVKHAKVVQGLKYGLTEEAIKAALSIRYFPAEKDGQRVSQYIQIEYNFNTH